MEIDRLQSVSRLTATIMILHLVWSYYGARWETFQLKENCAQSKKILFPCFKVREKNNQFSLGNIKCTKIILNIVKNGLSYLWSVGGLRCVINVVDINSIQGDGIFKVF